MITVNLTVYWQCGSLRSGPAQIIWVIHLMENCSLPLVTLEIDNGIKPKSVQGLVLSLCSIIYPSHWTAKFLIKSPHFMTLNM